MPGPLAAGERVLLIDPKERRYLLTLVAGATFHTHAGVLAHDDLIGATEGCTVTGSTGRSFLALRPTLGDIVLKMPRGAQVIYPKDLGAILIAADIAPGQRVLEAGVGSGALSMTVLRAGASVVGYELREDFAARARANVAATLGPDAPYRVEIRDVTQGIDETGLDRILLDMPEPHNVVAAAAAALRPGGMLLAYLPTINQTTLLRQSLDDDGRALRPGRDPGDHAAHVARRGALGPPRPPHGRPHRLPDHRAAPRVVTMDAGVRDYIDAIGPEQRPLFDRLHRIVLAVHPKADVALSYGMPAYRVGARRLNIGVWRHGVSVYGWRSGTATVASSPATPSCGAARGRSGSVRRDAEGISDGELRTLLGGALEP